MKHRKLLCNILFVLLGIVLLSACGGGDGGNNNNQLPVFSISPTIVELKQGEDETIQFSVTATPNITFSGSVFIYIIDSVGVIQPGATITNNGNNTYTVDFTTSSSLSVGMHSGNIEIRACGDAACNSHYPGSPMNLPYNIEVISSTNLTTLNPWTTVADWETFQRNTTHSGYVPVTLNSTDFSPRWRWLAPETGNQLRPVVAANGRVHVVSSGYFATTSKLYALDETDSSEVWSQSMGSVFRVNDPAVSGGNVYVATSGHADTAMWSYAANDGTLRFSTAYSSQWETYYAPVIDNGIVYTNGGTYGGLNAFNTSDGSDAWFTGLNQYDTWTPAVDSNYVYAYLGDSCSGCNNAGLSILDKATGAVVNTISDPDFNWTGWSIHGAPIVSSAGNILSINQANAYSSNQLVSFNLTNLNINWTATGIYGAQPALAKGVVYIANKSPLRLEARDETTGNLLWSWSPTSVDEDRFVHNVVATDNLIFVSTNKRVHAIDLVTHQSVWEYWRPGHIAISNRGILYIATTDGNNSNGALVAINLQ